MGVGVVRDKGLKVEKVKSWNRPCGAGDAVKLRFDLGV